MRKSLLTPLALLILAGSSCKRNNDNNPTVSTYGTYSSLDTIYQMLAVPSKFVNMDASVGASFYGSSGTRYIFPAGVFQDAFGNIVSGTVQVEVKELLKKGDMVFSKALPVCGADPLMSGGEIYTNATKNGQQLYLVPGQTFRANMPQGGPADPGMSFFRGQAVQDPANVVAWKPGQDSLGIASVVVNGDTISIISDSLHWANADRFLTAPINYQSFKVSLSVAGNPSYASDAIRTYAFYDNYKGVWPMGVFGSISNGVIQEDHVPNVPVHFVSFGVINKKFYGGVTGATPVTNGTYNVLLAEVDPVAFKGQLNNLTQ